MKKSLLLVAHGSRREASNDEVRALTARVREADDARFALIDCAFLELAEPAVLLRDPCATREAFRSTLLSTGLDPAAWMPRLVETEVSPAASTNARDELARGGTPTDLLDPRVLDYIREHGLYGG